MLVTVPGLAMLVQGGSLTGMLLPDQLLFFATGLFAAGIAASIPFPKRIYQAISAAAVAYIVAAGLHRLPAVEPSAASSIQITGGVQRGKAPCCRGNITPSWCRWAYPWNGTSRSRRQHQRCNHRLFIPEYGIGFSFAEGVNSIEFMPEESGEFAYSCWMGMIRGRIIVT